MNSLGWKWLRLRIKVYQAVISPLKRWYFWHVQWGRHWRKIRRLERQELLCPSYVTCQFGDICPESEYAHPYVWLKCKTRIDPTGELT